MKVDIEGVAVLILRGEKLLFVVNKRKYWKRRGSRWIISFANVGGRKEEGENILQTARRECKEEIGILPHIISSKRTFLIDLNYKVKEIKTPTRPRPFSIYLLKHKGKPGMPYAKGCFIAKVYVFLGEINKPPKPSSEIPAIIWLDWDMVMRSSKGGLKVRELLRKGVKIEEKDKIPRNAILVPSWTPKVFIKAFGKDLPTFLKSSFS